MSYHFLDRLLECEPGRRAVALKALALNEEFFRDHFPGMPVLPGALLLEGCVQTARRCLEGEGDGGWVLAEVENMRFNRFARPGEVLRMEVEREEGGEAGRARFRARAEVDGAAVARMRFTLAERPMVDGAPSLA